MTTIASAAATADAIVKEIAKIEPTVASVTGMFVPGAGPFIALAQPYIPTALSYLDRALADIAAGNGGDLGQAFIDLISHLTAGNPNAPALAPSATSATGAATAAK